MTEEQESTRRIAKTRAIFRRAAEECSLYGVTGEELAIASMYAAFDLAERHAGEGVAAVEWQRSACDTIERQLFEGGRRSPDGF
jgi:NifB/MoaA-like Fe-S oxidoreductase